jgi:hypothetical protein
VVFTMFWLLICVSPGCQSRGLPGGYKRGRPHHLYEGLPSLFKNLILPLVMLFILFLPDFRFQRITWTIEPIEVMELEGS